MPITLFNRPADLEPLLPGEDGVLVDIGGDVLRQSVKLGAMLHPVTRAQIASLMASMNGY